LPTHRNPFIEPPRDTLAAPRLRALRSLLRAHYKRLIGRWHHDRLSADTPHKEIADACRKQIVIASPITKTDAVWDYAPSRVYFEHNRVIRWEQSPL
jgi:hypothetical protein